MKPYLSPTPVAQISVTKMISSYVLEQCKIKNLVLIERRDAIYQMTSHLFDSEMITEIKRYLPFGESITYELFAISRPTLFKVCVNLGQLRSRLERDEDIRLLSEVLFLLGQATFHDLTEETK